MEHICAGGPDAVARKEERAEEVLREAKDSNRKIATVLRQQREAREARTVESTALAERLDRDRQRDRGGEAGERRAADETYRLRTQSRAGDGHARARDRERTQPCAACWTPSAARPHTQRVASELAKRHAAKTLEVAMKRRQNGGRLMGASQDSRSGRRSANPSRREPWRGEPVRGRALAFGEHPRPRRRLEAQATQPGGRSDALDPQANRAPLRRRRSPCGIGQAGCSRRSSPRRSARWSAKRKSAPAPRRKSSRTSCASRPSKN